MNGRSLLWGLIVAVAAGAVVGLATGCARTSTIQLLTAGVGNIDSLTYVTVRLKVEDCTGQNSGTITAVPETLLMKANQRVSFVIPGRDNNDIKWSIKPKGGNKQFFNNGSVMKVDGMPNNVVNNAYFTDPPASLPSGGCPNWNSCIFEYGLEVQLVSGGSTVTCATKDPKIKIRD